MKTTSTNEPELSRPLRAEKVPAGGVEESIVATPKERAALATRFGLVEITKLEATLHVTPKQLGLDFEVKGRVKADIVQRCVATLEPLPTHIEQDFVVHFVAPSLTDNGLGEHSLDEDDVESIKAGIMDLGEAAAQHLGLALDPYPRKQGVPPVDAEFGQKQAQISPFAKLVELKDKTKE